MMATLLDYQGENGMWRQLIDRPEAWPETSCTGMLTFAMVTGVKQGWLQTTPYTRAKRDRLVSCRMLVASRATRSRVKAATRGKELMAADCSLPARAAN
jgi:unsaturated rhamnogalacturonyl hydrolase